MSIKLVKFSNGKFGVRKGNWFTGYEYKHLPLVEANKKLWIVKSSDYFHECFGSEEDARKALAEIKKEQIKMVITEEVIE